MIESVKYEKSINDPSKNSQMILVEDGITRTVPLEPANRHYQMIQEWVAEGNTIEEGDD